MVMFLLTIMAVAILGAHAAPQQSSDVTPVPIINQSEVNGVDGSFNYSYEAGNGIKNQGSGFPKRISVPVLNADGSPTGQQEEQDIIVQTGSFTYTAPDGQIITLSYVADENGFQPVGDHIPTPPAIPDQILTSLKQQSNEANSARSFQVPANEPLPPAPVLLSDQTPL